MSLIVGWCRSRLCPSLLREHVSLECWFWWQIVWTSLPFSDLYLFLNIPSDLWFYLTKCFLKYFWYFWWTSYQILIKVILTSANFGMLQRAHEAPQEKKKYIYIYVKLIRIGLYAKLYGKHCQMSDKPPQIIQYE